MSWEFRGRWPGSSGGDGPVTSEGDELQVPGVKIPPPQALFWVSNRVFYLQLSPLVRVLRMSEKKGKMSSNVLNMKVSFRAVWSPLERDILTC